MKKFKLLLLDANVVIQLFRLGIWEQVIERCDVHLAKTIVDEEAHFFVDDEGVRQDFDLRQYVTSQHITEFDVTAAALTTFRDRFGPGYFEKLDPGETASLVYLLSLTGECWICSADAIVYRVLGNMDREEKGCSLEEVLAATGLGRALPREFTKEFRLRWTRKGFEEHMRSQGLK